MMLTGGTLRHPFDKHGSVTYGFSAAARNSAHVRSPSPFRAAFPYTLRELAGRAAAVGHKISSSIASPWRASVLESKYDTWPIRNKFPDASETAMTFYLAF